MKRITLSILAFVVCLTTNALTWQAPKLNTSDTFEADVQYYLYHVGRQQMLTFGGSWGTHAILDSTEVGALPYYITQTADGCLFYSPSAGSLGYLFREKSGSGVYTDYNNHGDSSRNWTITRNGDGTVTLTTHINDPVWGQWGTMVYSDEYTYQLGWNPNGEDVDKDGKSLGTNQSVYMLKPGVMGYETAWTFVRPNDFELYKAQQALYEVAREAENYGIDYSEYSQAYNGMDITAMNRAAKQLEEEIQKARENDVTHFFSLTDGSSMIFPDRFIEQWDEDEAYIRLTLKGDTAVTIAKSHIVSQSNEYQGELPVIESFKFNNKFNDQLFTDAIGEIDEEHGRIKVVVGCIGKRLTPSFQLSEGAKAYINGERQYSKQTRRRFDEPVTYTVAFPKQYIYNVVKVKDEVWSNPETNEDQWLPTKVNLTGDMFTTNAPSNHGETPANMLDGDPNTMFHSTWGSGTYTPLAWYDGATYGDGVSEWPYLDIALPESLYRLKFEYTTRANSDYAPLGFILMGSNDQTTWNEIQTFNAEKDNLPTTRNSTYTSPIINLGATYRYLRLQLTSSQRKNYLVLSEFAIYKVTENPDFKPEEPQLLSPAEYAKGFFPYGHNYEVTVDYLTDHPTSQYHVPRIDIWFGDYETWSSSMWIGRNGKTFYEDAVIKIDGAGVFPDMESTRVQIKGRGNSSWTNSSNSKNPYRLKFAEKQKPLGLTKGKSWVLLANKQNNSMTTNAIAMKIADMVETRGCNHIVPVELYVNNQYRGSYNFTEKVGFSNNSIDIDDETYATMLELDSYYDEEYKFRDANYNLYVNIQEPELSDPENGSMLSLMDIRDAFNIFTKDTKNGGTLHLDVDAFVRAMLVNDLVRNEECKHPKSWFLYNENVMADSLWQFGPVWDFDWSFGYEGSSQYFIRNAEADLFSNMNSGNVGYPFFRQLLRGSEVVKKAYYRLWTEFIQDGKLDELIEYCDEYFQYAQPSLEHNANGVEGDYDWWTGTYSNNWGDGTQYATTTANAKNWLTQRANYIYTHLDKYDLSDDIIGPEEDDYGQPDRVDLAEVASRPVNVYTINGILVRKQVPYGRFNIGLMPGIYIVDGKKIAIK